MGTSLSHAVAETRSLSSAITENMRRISNAALIFLILSSGCWGQTPDNYEPVVNTGPVQRTQPTPASTSVALAMAARDLPAPQRTQVTQAALSIILLTKFNRLLPPSPNSQELDHLSSIFITTEPKEAEQNSAAQKLPPADTLVFDGSKLSGGNFRYIDAMIGMEGQPIAFDRELPTWILPLTSSAAKGLTSSQQNFASQPSNANLAELTNRIYQANVAPNLAADGIFIRPYAGRVDDLYYHLVQNEDQSHLLDYFTLLDSLPPRQYSPITGTRSPQDVPPSRVNLSDILSAGSLRAIQKFRTENPRSRILNPFKSLAVRILPSLGDSMLKVKPGDEWEVSRENMRKAMNDTRRFTPGKVPPIFNDPSRFLGWNDPRYVRVAKKKKPKNALIEEIQKIDFETPLPEMTFDPAGNELLKGNELYANQTDVTEESAHASLLADLGMTEHPPTPSFSSQKTNQNKPTSESNSPPPLFVEEDIPALNPIPEEPIASASPTPAPEVKLIPEPQTKAAPAIAENSPSPTPQDSPTQAANPEEHIASTLPTQPSPALPKSNEDPQLKGTVTSAQNPPPPVPNESPTLKPQPTSKQPSAVDFIQEKPEELIASTLPKPASSVPPEPIHEPQIKEAIAVTGDQPSTPEPEIRKALPASSPSQDSNTQSSAVDFITEMPAERVPESHSGNFEVAVDRKSVV